MNKKTKIIIGVALPVALFGAYWFIYRNRKPSLNLEETDWDNNIAVIKFGKNKKTVPLGAKGGMNAGATYNPNLYDLNFDSKGKIMTFSVMDKSGNVVDKQTLDFGTKIRY